MPSHVGWSYGIYVSQLVLDLLPVIQIKLTTFPIDVNSNYSLRIPRRLLRAWQVMLTFHGHLTPLLFCEGVRGFQTFLPCVYVLSLICFKFVSSLWTMLFWPLTWIFYTRLIEYPTPSPFFIRYERRFPLSCDFFIRRLYF